MPIQPKHRKPSTVSSCLVFILSFSWIKEINIHHSMLLALLNHSCCDELHGACDNVSTFVPFLVASSTCLMIASLFLGTRIIVFEHWRYHPQFPTNSLQQSRSFRWLLARLSRALRCITIQRTKAFHARLTTGISWLVVLCMALTSAFFSSLLLIDLS